MPPMGRSALYAVFIFVSTMLPSAVAVNGATLTAQEQYDNAFHMCAQVIMRRRHRYLRRITGASIL